MSNHIAGKIQLLSLYILYFNNSPCIVINIRCFMELRLCLVYYFGTLVPTKHLYILVPAFLWHCTEHIYPSFMQFAENTFSSKDDIWDEFSEQFQHKSIKSTIFTAQLAFFWVQIRCRFNAVYNLTLDIYNFMYARILMIRFPT